MVCLRVEDREGAGLESYAKETTWFAQRLKATEGTSEFY
jgi:hypothetical protein